MNIAFFVLAVVSALSTCLAVFTPRRPPVLGWLGWVIGLLPCEVPCAALVVNAVLLVLFSVFGALDSALGIAAIVLVAAAMLGDLVLVRRCRAAGPAVGLALVHGLGANFEQCVDPGLAPAIDGRSPSPSESLGPFRARRRDVVHVADIPYGEAGVRNHLDLYVHRSRPQNCPVLIYLHGGAWTHGRKDQQGLPIVYHFASRGWLCIQPNYRLCPDATFPDPLVDTKRAIAWVHQHARSTAATRSRSSSPVDLPERT